MTRGMKQIIKNNQQAYEMGKQAFEMDIRAACCDTKFMATLNSEVGSNIDAFKAWNYGYTLANLAVPVE